MAQQRFPLLEQLRAERERAEDQITAPYKAEIVSAAGMIQSLRRRLSEIEKMMGSRLAGEIESRMADELTQSLMRIVTEAAAKASGPFSPVTVTFPAEVARFILPSTIEAEIVKRYRQDTMPRLRLSVDEMSSDECATVIDIRLPALGFRQVVRNDLN